MHALCVGQSNLVAMRKPASNTHFTRQEWFFDAAFVLAIAALLIGVSAILVVWSGFYDVAASAGHWPITRDILNYAMVRSVKFHARELKTPNLDKDELIMRGAAYYETGCAPCHGAPGKPNSPIERAATPPPPDLRSIAEQFTPSELHWIIKHGIKMTAMPAWPTQERNDEVWAVVAFLERLPRIDPKAYTQLVSGELQLAGEIEEKVLLEDAHSGPPENKTCVRCHGRDGRGRGAIPNIAGLEADYIYNALRAFADGSRPSGFMQPVASELTESATRRLAEYYAALPRGTSPLIPADRTDLESGERLALFGNFGTIPACLICHRHDPAQFSGIPQLGEQNREYLVQQLELFRSGIRANTPNDAIMSQFARQLSDQQIRDVAAFFEHL